MGAGERLTTHPMTYQLTSCAAVLAAIALLSAPAQAGSVTHPKAVVELFTSQGCASCPPADAMLTDLAKSNDVVALAFHVDYWDYAGWQDTFGSADYSDRQRAYAESWNSSRIYTPQMVVNGAVGVVGSRSNEVHGALAGAALPLAVGISEDAGMLKIAVPADKGRGDAVIWLVTYLTQADVVIDKGENAGKSMSYTQVVTDQQALGMWEDDAGATIKLPLPEVLRPGTGLAVLVQQENNGLPGLILGAATYEP